MRPNRVTKFLGGMLTLALLLSACGGGDVEGADPPPDDADDTTADDGDGDDAGSDEAEADDAESDEAEPVTLEIWFNGYPDQHGPQWEELIAEYEADNPNVTIDWELLAWNVYLDRISTAAAGGTLPDALFTYSSVIPSLAEQGILADHADYMDPDDFVDIGVELTTWDGVWSAVPYYISTRALTYRKDLAEEAGLDPESPPASWDELLTWAEELTIVEDGQTEQLGFTVRQGIFFAIPDLFMTALWSNGGEIFNEEGTESTVDSPEGVETAALIKELFDCCDAPGAIEAESTGLGQGKVAMLVSVAGTRGWENDFPDLVEAGAGGLASFPPGPSDPDSKGTVTVGGDAMAITSQSEHPEETARFLEFLMADAENSIRLAGLASDIPGAAAAEGEPYFEETPFVADKRDILFEYGRVAPLHPGGSAEISRIMTTWLDELTVGDGDPQTVVEGMAADLTQMVADSGIPVRSP